MHGMYHHRIMIPLIPLECSGHAIFDWFYIGFHKRCHGCCALFYFVCVFFFRRKFFYGVNFSLRQPFDKIFHGKVASVAVTISTL